MIFLLVLPWRLTKHLCSILNSVTVITTELLRKDYLVIISFFPIFTHFCSSRFKLRFLPKLQVSMQNWKLTCHLITNSTSSFFLISRKRYRQVKHLNRILRDAELNIKCLTSWTRVVIITYTVEKISTCLSIPGISFPQ